jgi:hypothetical protein
MVGGVLLFIERFAQLLFAPSTHPDLGWIVVPLLVIIVLMTLYFSKYRDEELGWNTALGNSMILVFVSLDLLRVLFNRSVPGSVANVVGDVGAVVLIGLLFVGGVLLLFVNFTHLLPKSIAYVASSPLQVNVSAYVVITIIYSGVPIDVLTVLAGSIFLVVLLLVFSGIGFLTRKWWVHMEKLKRKEKIQDVKKEKKILESTKKIVKEKEKKIEKAVKQEKKIVKKKQADLKKMKSVLKNNKKASLRRKKLGVLKRKRKK